MAKTSRQLRTNAGIRTGLRNNGADLGGVGAFDAGGVHFGGNVIVGVPGDYAGVGIGGSGNQAGVYLGVRPAGLRAAIDVETGVGGRAWRPRQAHRISSGCSARSRERNDLRRVGGIAGDGDAAGKAARGGRIEGDVEGGGLTGGKSDGSSATGNGEARAGSGKLRDGDAGVAGVCQSDGLHGAGAGGDAAETQGGWSRGD